MITLLLGSDNFAKKQYIDNRLKQLGAEAAVFTDASNLRINELFVPQLFGPLTIPVLDHVWKDLDLQKVLDIAGTNPNAHLFILEDSLDKRLNVNKEFVKDSRVTTVQLDSPIGLGDSVIWIRKFASENNIKIDATVATNLANAILPDQESTLPVLRAQNELLKLKACANGDPITPQMIEQLVEPTVSMDVFALTNAISARNKKLALQLLNEYFELESGDEKSNAIKVAALLFEQFRSLAIAIDALNRHMTEAEVLQLTGWKQGRLYIMNKTARNFTLPKVQQALSKLENLDRELKTGSMPPHVVLDLIIADI